MSGTMRGAAAGRAGAAAAAGAGGSGGGTGSGAGNDTGSGTGSGGGSGTGSGANVEIDLRLELGAFPLVVGVRVGGATAVLGPSGAGKTSLLHAVAGLRRAAGRVAVGGAVLQDTAAGVWLPPERRRLGYVPQSARLFPHLSVRRNLLFGAGAAEARRGAGFDELVDALDLAPLLGRYPRHLSGGERRRVALGRALLARPRLLLLDEPTEGLDAERSRRALAQVRAASALAATPFLVVTHKLHEALALARDVVVLEAGRVVATGPAGRVLSRRGALADGRSANLVRARVAAHRPADGVTEVVADDGEALSIPADPGLGAGSEVLLTVDAEEILVAVAEPAGLSARNVVAGRIEALDEVAGSVWVRTGGWTARLTRAAARDLELDVGRRIWFVVKTHSWRVLAGGAAPGRGPGRGRERGAAGGHAS